MAASALYTVTAGVAGLLLGFSAGWWYFAPRNDSRGHERTLKAMLVVAFAAVAAVLLTLRAAPSKR